MCGAWQSGSEQECCVAKRVFFWVGRSAIMGSARGGGGGLEFMVMFVMVGAMVGGGGMAGAGKGSITRARGGGE